MAWDTEGTRRRLKEAAAAEFAEHGPDGTTMARIAGRAGINKERLYKYFGDKQALFETVLTAEFDLDAVRRYREAWGVFRDRRPDLYYPLLSLDGRA